MAATAATRADAAHCAGLLARAAIASAHARLTARGEWALNEKGIVGRAGLADAAALLTALGSEPEELRRAVTAMRELLAPSFAGLPDAGA